VQGSRSSKNGRAGGTELVQVFSIPSWSCSSSSSSSSGDNESFPDWSSAASSSSHFTNEELNSKDLLHQSDNWTIPSGNSAVDLSSSSSSFLGNSINDDDRFSGLLILPAKMSVLSWTSLADLPDLSSSGSSFFDNLTIGEDKLDSTAGGCYEYGHHSSVSTSTSSKSSKRFLQHLQRPSYLV
jgi:hypothetical protein